MIATTRKQILLNDIKKFDEQHSSNIIDLIETYIAEEELDRAMPFLDSSYYQKRKAQLEKVRERMLNQN